MPLRHTAEGWFWGSKGPFKTRAQAERVARAAYAHGYRGRHENGTSSKRGKKKKKGKS